MPILVLSNYPLSMNNFVPAICESNGIEGEEINFSTLLSLVFRHSGREAEKVHNYESGTACAFQSIWR